MPITKKDLNNLQKSLISEISKFLIERADRHGKNIESHEERITSLEQPIIDCS